MVTGRRGKEEGRGNGVNSAGAKVRVTESGAKEVGAIGGGVGALGVWGRGGWKGDGGIEVEEGHGIVVEGIGDAGSGSAANIHGVAAVMVEFRAEVKSAEAVVAPGGAGFGGGMGGNELAGGVDGMGGEVKGQVVYACPGRYDGREGDRWGMGAEVIERQLHEGEEEMP